jgi:hypothetical protein
MKKITLLFVLALSLGALWVSGGKRVLEEEVSRSALGRTAETAASVGAAPQASASPAETVDSVRAISSVPVRPSAYFPGARVLSSVTVEGRHRGEVLVIKTVETEMNEPYVRIEETYREAAGGAGRELVNQAAMVANQILVSRPQGVDEQTFVNVLFSAGAVDVKKRGAGYLATFPAAPEDPRALDSFIERVRESSGVALVIEPNYIRRLNR